MAKLTADIVLDAACDYIKNNVTEMYINTTQPATRAAAIADSLATKTGLTAGSFTGPEDGTVSGRKITKNAENSVAVIANGTGTHIALCSGTVLLSVVTMTSQVLTNGNTVNIPAFRVIEIADVTQ